MRGRHRIAKVAPVVAVAAAVVGGGGLAAAEGLGSAHTQAAPTPHLRGWPHGAVAGSAHFTSDNVRDDGGSTWQPTIPRASNAFPAAFGKVTKVDGSTTTGTCGVAGAAGTFTLANPKATTSVSVSSATKYYAKTKTLKTGATFANLCVGDFAAARGTSASTGSLSATTVFVASPGTFRHRLGGPAAFGKVTKVDGSTTTGTCGVAGAAGTFTLANPKATTSVSVSSATKYYAKTKTLKTGATFANLCVGDFAAARGTSASTGSLSATTVFVANPGTYHPTARRMRDWGHLGAPTHSRYQTTRSQQDPSYASHESGWQQQNPQRSSRPDSQATYAPPTENGQTHASQPARTSDPSSQARQPASDNGSQSYGSQSYGSQSYGTKGQSSSRWSSQASHGNASQPQSSQQGDDTQPSSGYGGSSRGGSQGGGWQGSRGTRTQGY